METSPRSSIRRAYRLVVTAALLLAATVPMRAEGLRTTTRVQSTYRRGEVEFTCLFVNGGKKLLPLNVPEGAQLSGRAGILTLRWAERASALATLRAATTPEAALLQPVPQGEVQIAPAADWSRVLAAGLAPGIEGFTPRALEPDVFSLNDWRSGALVGDYTLGGAKFSRLLLLCRFTDGTTMSVVVECPAEQMEDCRREVLTMLSPVPLDAE